MHPPGADTVVVRHGDVGVKSSEVRHRMEQRLRENIVALLDDRNVAATVEREWGRIFVRTDDVAAATDAATDAFGVVSASPALSVESELDAVVTALSDTAEAAYDGGSFAVRARRAGDHEFTSKTVEEEGGAAIWSAVENRFEPEVDLDDPDLTFGVEVRGSESFVFLENRSGPGGLPLGTQSPLIALISGGHDSPIAAWEAMKRGSPVIPLYVDFGDYGGVDHRLRAAEVVRRLASYAPERDMQLRVLSAGDVADELVDEVGPTRMLSLRRFMFRAAAAVAREERAAGIVTGEAIGQKSSQTAGNLAVTDRVTELPIHRPLLTMDKQPIIDRARELGTFEDSTIQAGCNRIAPEHPETNARVQQVRKAEPEDLLDRAERAAENVRVLEIEPQSAVSGD